MASPQDWSVQDVLDWLEKALSSGSFNGHVETYKHFFASHFIDGPSLLELTPDMIRKMGVHAVGHALGIARLISELKSGGGSGVTVRRSSLIRTELPEGLILCMGNPLLDISAEVSEAFLQKYEVKPNDAILCEDKHKPVYVELEKNFAVSYIAGGSTQNTARIISWMLQKKNVVRYMGGVGKDDYAKRLKESAVSEGVDVHYMEIDEIPTGTCAVLITGSNRSLIANLSAANHYKVDHLLLPENQKIMEQARFYYMAGFFLTVSPPSIQLVAKHAAAHNKVFSMNLSAPFISQFFDGPLLDALPYVDYLFGNESEAEAFADRQAWENLSIGEIALKISRMPKVNTQRDRIVIITQGSSDTIVAGRGEIRQYPIVLVPKEKIVDTNGAGDAFAGGFLSQILLGRPVEDAVHAGHYCASMVIQRSGCTHPPKPEFK